MYALCKTYHPSVTNLLRLQDVVGIKSETNLPRLIDAAGFSGVLKTFPSFFARFDKNGMIFAEREREREFTIKYAHTRGK